MQKKVDKLIKEVADKYNLPAFFVEDIFISQFKVVAETMANDKHQTILLQYWGKFFISKWKLKRILEHNENRIKSYRENI